MKKLAKIMLVLLLVLPFAGCKGKDKSNKELENYTPFTFEDITIYVPKTETMEETTMSDFDYAVGNDNMVICLKHVSMADITASGQTLEELEKVVFEGQEVTTYGKCKTFEYTREVEGTNYYYTYSLFTTAKNVWDIHIISFLEDKEKNRPVMLDIISKIDEKK